MLFLGDFADGMYFLESGEVIVTRSEEGVEKEVDRLREGAIFGELALITQRPRAATVVANGKDAGLMMCCATCLMTFTVDLVIDL